MPAKRRSHINLRRKVGFTVTRVSVGDDRLAYAMVADKKYVYPDGRSRVVYIGTTERGIFRVTSSIAERANEILRLPGFESFDVRVISCHRRKHIKMWFKLEHALLVGFREIYGSSPRCNNQNAGKRAGTVFNYFSRKRIKRVLEDLA